VYHVEIRMSDSAQEIYNNLPYGGLFGETNQIKVIRQIIADPFGDYRPKEIEALVEASAPSVRRVLKNLTHLGLLIKDTTDKQHPVYRVNVTSPMYLALTFLAYAIPDHKNATNYMDDSIADYYNSELRAKYESSNAIEAPHLDKTLYSIVKGCACSGFGLKPKLVQYDADSSLSQGEMYKPPSITNLSLNCPKPESAVA